jgi:hypothetical protein
MVVCRLLGRKRFSPFLIWLSPDVQISVGIPGLLLEAPCGLEMTFALLGS